MSDYMLDDGLLIQYEHDEKTGLTYAAYVHDLYSVPTYQHLLGTSSLVETIAAMNLIAEHGDGGWVDEATHETVWHQGRVALRSLLDDSASAVSMMSESGEVMDDPVTATWNLIRGRCGLPLISNQVESQVLAATLAEDESSPVSTGVDLSSVDVPKLTAFLASSDVSHALDDAEEGFWDALMPQQTQGD